MPLSDRPHPDERRFRALASGSLERIAELDASGRTIYRSPNHGDAGADMSRVHPDDRERVARAFAAAYGEGEGQRISFRVIGEDGGAPSWAEVTISPFDAEDGRHVLVVSRDVSEARATEQQLRESRARFQRIAETAYDMIVECDPDWRIVFANARVREVLGGLDPDQLTHERQLHPDDLAHTTATFESVRSGEREFAQTTFRTRHADGSFRWVEVSVQRAERGSGPSNVLVIGRDATDRVAAEQRVRESEERYRALVESAPLGIYVTRGGALLYANEAGVRMLGAKDPAELRGEDLTRFLRPENREEIAAQVRAALTQRGGPFQIDLDILDRDGHSKRVQGEATPTTWEGQPAIQSIVRDVTEVEQSRVERERLQLQLQEARKLESLGVLAGGIAHDFNNLLAVILSNVRYAREEEPGSREATEALNDAEEAAEGAARLVRQLLAYAGRRAPEVKSVELTGLVESVSELLGSALPRGAQLRVDLSRDPLHVHADLVQLEQVLMNLVLNAAEALEDEPGLVSVRTARLHLGPRDLAGWRGGDALPEGDYASLEIEDTGVGMSEEVCARIFDPFFTTKPAGHGLGLSAVLGLVKGHRGAIRVQSAPGRGSRIQIALPLESEAGRPVREACVLVADGDRGFRERVVGALGRLDARVLEAGDTAEASRLWALHGEEIGAVVLDADLAGPGDGALIRALRGAPSALPVLLVHAAQVAPSPDLRALAFAALPRPCSDAALGERVGELLSKTPSA